MDFSLLQDVVVILGISVFISLIFNRFNIPPILGFLATGIIAGPHGLSLVNGVKEVEVLAEIGVVFLLFVIGIEFSLKTLSSIKKTVFLGGSIQVFGTVLLVFVLTNLMGLTWQEALILGFIFSLSSTAIVLKSLQEKGEIMSPHGRISLGILIFQDLIVVPMLLIIPIISGQEQNVAMAFGILAIKVLLIISLLIVLARYIVPYILKQVVKTKNQELFLLTIIVICFAIAWLTHSIGLSLALGAFFAGLIISESDYSHQANANILPFREIFISFFFVSIGMLLNGSFFIENFVSIHLYALALLTIKMIVIFIAVIFLGFPMRTVLVVGLSLFQVGEFAFILSSTGLFYNLITETNYQYILSISIISMGATPFVIRYSAKISQFLLSRKLPKEVRKRLNTIGKNHIHANQTIDEGLKDHIVIIGYGINGQNVAIAAKKSAIDYVVVELDPDSYHLAAKNENYAVFGDASKIEILKHVHIQSARVAVIASSDPENTKKIITGIRSLTEKTYVIVRTRYLKEIEENLKLGADEVIPEEFETSIEIFSRVLKKYLIPPFEISKMVKKIRSRNYDFLRNLSGIGTSDDVKIQTPDLEVSTITVHCDSNDVVGKSLVESRIRQNYGVTVLAIKRGEDYISEILPSEKILPDDVLYLFGPASKIEKLCTSLEIKQ